MITAASLLILLFSITFVQSEHVSSTQPQLADGLQSTQGNIQESNFRQYFSHVTTMNHNVYINDSSGKFFTEWTNPRQDTVKQVECKLNRTGDKYKGTVSQTYSGYVCQRWADQHPHAHSIGVVSSEFPENSRCNMFFAFCCN